MDLYYGHVFAVTGKRFDGDGLCWMMFHNFSMVFPRCFNPVTKAIECAYPTIALLDASEDHGIEHGAIHRSVHVFVVGIEAKLEAVLA